MKVAIEGMDGSGKTTVAKAVARNTGYKYLERPIENFFGLDSKTYDEMCIKMWDMNEPNKTLWFFGLGHLLAVSGSENQNVILDRHILSTYFWDGNDENQNVFQSLVDCGVLPDLTIILYADLETRINRIKERDSKDADLILDKVYEEGYTKMLEFADKYNMPYIIVNTEDRTLDEIINECTMIVVEHMKDESEHCKQQDFTQEKILKKCKDTMHNH